MQFRPMSLTGLVLVEPERHADERGHFERVFCEDEFAAAGLPTRFAQHSLSFNRLRGTLRGLHCQVAPYEEAKLVRCIRGAVFDVVVDLRPDSKCYGGWWGGELSADNGRALYIPPGFAHGFQAMSDEAELLYLISVPFVPTAAAGLRWDDPALGIDWPLPVSMISERDRQLPTLAQYSAANGGGAMKANP